MTRAHFCLSLFLLAASFFGAANASAAGRKAQLAIVFPEDPSNTNAVGNVAKCMSQAVVDDWKRKGSQISVEFFNDKRDALTAGVVAEKIVRGKFDVAIGTTLSSQALILARVLDEAGIPFFAPLATHPAVVEGKKYAVRLPFSDRRQAKLLADYALRRKPKRILILKNDSLPYSTFLADQFLSRVIERDEHIQVQVIAYIDGKFDPKAVSEAASKAQSDVIFAPIYSLDVAATYSALASAVKGRTLLLGADAIGAGPTFVKAMGSPAPNLELAFVQHNPKHFEGPEAKRMSDLFAKGCPDLTFNVNAASAFDLTESTIRALRSPKYDEKASSFKLALADLRFHGTLGPIVFGLDGEPDKPVHIYTIRDGSEIFMETMR